MPRVAMRFPPVKGVAESVLERAQALRKRAVAEGFMVELDSESFSAQFRLVEVVGDDPDDWVYEPLEYPSVAVMLASGTLTCRELENKWHKATVK